MQEPTEQQVRLMEAYKAADFTKIHETTKKQIEGVANDAAVELGTVLAKFIGAFKNMALAQAEELCIQRQIEQAARCETMTDELWTALTGQLNAMREKQQEVQKAMIQAAEDGMVRQ